MSDLLEASYSKLGICKEVYEFGAKIENGAAVIDLAINDNQGGAASSKFNIASDTLTLTADSNTTTVRAELVWGSFDE